MASIRTKRKARVKNVRKTSYGRLAARVINGDEVLLLDPETEVGVKSSRIYAQIAKTGRKPELLSTRIALISALNSASITHGSTGHATTKMAPEYVRMTVSDIKACFGDEISKMPTASFIEIKK